MLDEFNEGSALIFPVCWIFSPGLLFGYSTTSGRISAFPLLKFCVVLGMPEPVFGGAGDKPGSYDVCSSTCFKASSFIRVRRLVSSRLGVDFFSCVDRDAVEVDGEAFKSGSTGFQDQSR